MKNEICSSSCIFTYIYYENRTRSTRNKKKCKKVQMVQWNISLSVRLLLVCVAMLKCYLPILLHVYFNVVLNKVQQRWAAYYSWRASQKQYFPQVHRRQSNHQAGLFRKEKSQTLILNFAIISARQHAERAICYRKSICPSVCLSVCLSHGWISRKRLKLGSCNFHRTVAPSL